MHGHVLLQWHLRDVDNPCKLGWLPVCLILSACRFDNSPTNISTWGLSLTCLSACLSVTLSSKQVGFKASWKWFKESTATFHSLQDKHIFWNTSEQCLDPVCQGVWKVRQSQQSKSKVNCIWPVFNVGSNPLVSLSFSLFSFMVSFFLYTSPPR